MNVDAIVASYSPNVLEVVESSGIQAVGSTHLPGDVISTGTPGAVVLRGGDVLGCRIEGFEPLENPVRRY
jgi:hypothetical protein